MDDMIGEPYKEMSGWRGSVTHLSQIEFPTSTTVPYLSPVLYLTA